MSHIVMKTFTIDPSQRNKLVRALTVRLGVIFALVLVTSSTLGALYLFKLNPNSDSSSVAVMAVAIIVLAVIVASRLYLQVREYQKGLDNLVLSIGTDRIDRNQVQTGAMRVTRAQVTAMVETDAGVLVMTDDKNRFVWVPSQLRDYDSARKLLAQWMPIHTMPPRSAQSTKLLTLAWGLVTALCVGILLLATDPWQVAMAGAATIAIYLFVFRMIRQQHDNDLKFRRIYSGVLLFLIIVVIIKVMMTIGPFLASR